MADQELLELCGSVENIIYHNEKNQYSVIEIQSGDELVTAVGVFPYISEGEEVKIYGVWTNHPTFGPQFKASAFEKSAPKTTAAMLRYLSGGAVKGIGPVTAKKIVAAFGEHTLEVIENEPQRLTQIKGITMAKALDMSEEFKRVYGIRELMLFLSEYGIKPEQTVRVWKTYGPNSKDLIKEDPYVLCDESVGIDFGVADSIAMKLDKAMDADIRVKAGILYVLRRNMISGGHTCIPFDKLIPVSANLLGVNGDVVASGVESLVGTFDIVKEDIDGRIFAFLPKVYHAEHFAAERLALMLHYPPQSIENVDEDIDRIEKQDGITYAEKQKDAIRAALQKGLLILTGGPGTGKTTTLNAIIRLLKEKGEKVLLAAPTGRAAKRMSEVTGEEAKTIHRLLQVDWDEQDNPIFTKNEGNPLECDTVVIDELSMVDSSVFEGVLHALPLGCRLILVGDADQLPSVGAGNVLGDLINSKCFPTIQLKEIFRQSMESLIVTSAHKIVEGKMPELNIKNNDFFFMNCENSQRLCDTVRDLCVTRLPNAYGYSSITDIQVLCPSRKGEVGTMNLNRILRDAINPVDGKKKQQEIFGTVYREGDKVMQIKNDYELPWEKADGSMGQGVFNGDMGVIKEIDRSAGVIRVIMDDRIVSYDTDKAGSELEHAYAITVHKSQGNEFPAVIIPLFKTNIKLSYRNLLYTGVTRAKKLLILIGSRSVIANMVANDSKTKRYTGLEKFIVQEVNSEKNYDEALSAFPEFLKENEEKETIEFVDFFSEQSSFDDSGNKDEK